MVALPLDSQIALAMPTTGTAGDSNQCNAVLTALRDCLAQPSLNALNGVSPLADRVFYYSSTTGGALATFNALGRSIVGAASQAAAQSALGLGSLAPLSTVGAANVTLSAANRLLGSGSTTAGSEITTGAGLLLSAGVLSCTVSATGGGMPDPGANGLMVRTALNTDTARSFANSTTITWTNADGTAGNPTAAVSPGGINFSGLAGTVALGSQVSGVLAQANGGLGSGTVQTQVNNLLTGMVVPGHLGTEVVVTTTPRALTAADSGKRIVMNVAGGTLTSGAASTLATAGSTEFSVQVFAQQAFTFDGPGATNTAVAALGMVTIATLNGTVYCSPPSASWIAS